MSGLKEEFDSIVEKNEQKIKILDAELSNGYFHTFLNLNNEYKIFINGMGDLFYKYRYIIPYEMYDYFYKTNCKKYNLLFNYSKYLKGAGHLPGAFLKEAINDLDFFGIHVLIFIEQKNNFYSKSIDEIYSLKLIDDVLQTEEYHNNLRGYDYDDIKISDEYLSAAERILREFDKIGVDKAINYYEKSLAFLKKSSASSKFESWIYDTHYIKLNKLLSSYKSALEKYRINCNVDINKELFECNYSNYRQAQYYMKNAMLNQINSLITEGKYKDAMKLAEEYIEICEERVKNYLSTGVKLSLQKAYELILTIPTLQESDKSLYLGKLNLLKNSMTHEDYFVKDGDKEYPIMPN